MTEAKIVTVKELAAPPARHPALNRDAGKGWQVRVPGPAPRRIEAAARLQLRHAQ